MKKGVFLNLLLSAFVFLVILTGLELSCRFIGLGQRPEHYVADWQRQWGDEFYTLSGNGFSRDGVRDRDHSIKNPQRRTRIVFIGDSVTYGYGLEPSQSYPAILQNLLARTGDDSTEVFNIALPGWSARQQRIAYMSIARKYAPSLVILGFCLNDVPEMNNNLTGPQAGPVAFAYRHSYLVRYVMDAEGREIRRVEELFSDPDLPSVKRGWQLLLRELEMIAKEVERDGVHFSVLIFPFRFQVTSEAPGPVPQRLLLEFCRENKIECLDLLPVLKPLGPEGFIDYDHLSESGAARVARAVVDSGLLIRD